MVGIVAEEGDVLVFQFEVEATVNTAIGLHAIEQFLAVAAVQLCHGHGGNAVFDVDGDGLSQLHVLNALDGRDEVEGDFTVVDDDVLGMEVALVEAVFIDLHPLLHVGLHLKSLVDDEGTARLDECGVVAETFQIGLFRTVDVEMVGVGAGDDRHPGAQPVERTVEFIGLNHHVVALFGEDIVGAVVLGDTSEEGIAVDAALVHDVGAHG